MKELVEDDNVIWIHKEDFYDKPFPEEHACRLKSPDQFDRFARKNCDQKHDGKCIDVIFGIKEGKSEIQALRYPKGIWTAASARAHCKERGGSFEAATKGFFDDVLEKDVPLLEKLEFLKNKLNEITDFVVKGIIKDKLLTKTPDQSVVEESGEDAAISDDDEIIVEKSDLATATSDGDEQEIEIIDDGD